MHARSIAAPPVANLPTIAIGITFSDRGDNRAKATCYCAFATSQADAWSLANAIADKMLDMSNGVVSKIELSWRYRPDSPADPAGGSDVSRKVLLLMENDDDDINGVVVPSPGDIFEATGAYAGIRVDLTSAGAIGWQSMLLALDLRTDDDRQLGELLAAGGLAL